MVNGILLEMMRSRKGYARKVLYKFSHATFVGIYIVSGCGVQELSMFFMCVHRNAFTFPIRGPSDSHASLFLKSINGQDFLGCLLLKHSFSLESNYLYMT